MQKANCTAIVKIPLTFSEASESLMDGQSRICNWLYNQLLEKASELREAFCKDQSPEIAKTLYTERGLRNLVPFFKKENPFLKVVHSSPLKNTALRLSQSIISYQKSRKGKRKGKKTGWPRFRSWSRGWFSLLYDEPGKGFRLEGKKLTLSLGMGAEKDQRRVEAELESCKALEGKEIRNLRIVKQLGLFYAVFTVHRELPQEKPIKKVIALDPNHKNLVYGVDNKGEAIEVKAPKWIKKIDLRLDELKGKRDRCQRKSQLIKTEKKSYWKASKRWEKFDRKIESLLRKRREQSKSFLFTLAHALYEQYDLVAIGDYTPNGSEPKRMRRSMNNQSLIGRFKEVLSWVAKKSGKKMHEFCEKGTTRNCSHCGYVVKEGLSPDIREWNCPGCSFTHLRDENASKNGLKKSLKDLLLGELVPGSGLVCVSKRWAWCAKPSGVEKRPRGSCSNKVAAPRNQNGSVVASRPKVTV